MSVITAITAQSTVEISDILKVPAKIIEGQLETLLEDISIHAIKTGMLLSSDIIELVIKKIKRLNVPVVVDPIIKAGIGRTLLEDPAIDVVRTQLFPISEIVTPNIYEAEKISGIRIASEEQLLEAAENLLKNGSKAILIKGGHLDSKNVVDLLLLKDGTQKKFVKKRVAKQDRHGSGCVLSAAITANLALEYELYESVELAEKYLEKIYPDRLKIGHGTPPINPFYNLF